MLYGWHPYNLLFSFRFSLLTHTPQTCTLHMSYYFDWAPLNEDDDDSITYLANVRALLIKSNHKNEIWIYRNRRYERRYSYIAAFAPVVVVDGGGVDNANIVYFSRWLSAARTITWTVIMSSIWSILTFSWIGSLFKKLKYVIYRQIIGVDFVICCHVLNSGSSNSRDYIKFI